LRLCPAITQAWQVNYLLSQLLQTPLLQAAWTMIQLQRPGVPINVISIIKWEQSAMSAAVAAFISAEMAE
jgi:hypothetical protein